MPKKIFTVDEVLTAADVNDYLMNQTVMTFAGTAARGSAISLPTEGMYAHLNDTDALEYYNGTSWVNRIPTPVSPGLEFIGSYPIGTAVTSVTVSNVFNSTYDHYRIHTQNSGNTVNGAKLRLQLSGSTSGSNYYGGGIQTLFSSGAVSSNWDNNVARFNSIGNNTEMYVDVFNPFLARSTRVAGAFFTTVAAGHYAGYILTSNSDTGFTISIESGTMTGGEIIVYGYRKA